MISDLIRAFENVREGFSTDRVLADPQLRERFFQCCRQLGIEQAPDQLARELLNLRKRGRLAGIKSQRTTFCDDDYRFAAEIAVRHLERKYGITLDDIISSNSLLDEFDAVCEKLCSGYAKLQYRWSALSLRKSRSISPELISRVVPSDAVLLKNLRDIKVDELPSAPGLYVFLTSCECLYVGEASNLRMRLKKHLDHSDNKLLARYLWDQGSDDVSLELHVISKAESTKVRRALETELIRSRHPVFNVLGVSSENR
jgi:predicted GIY-YIG superfamily endonuclease